jgi:protein-(glutamine-N5) methyltransferase, release factor-specific
MDADITGSGGQAAATVRELADGCGLPRLEAAMLMSHVLDRPRAWLIAHDTDPVAPQAAATFRELAALRRAGRPMAYLIGQREFMGHMFRVTDAVLIPRPETELLVEAGLAHLRSLAAGGAAPTVVDLGTGSGAIAISIALAFPRARVTATDASAAALAVAADNAARLGARVEFLQGDWYAALPEGGRYDLIVANPPYIAAADPHLAQGDLRHEPGMALTDGADGLSALRVLAQGAPQRLAPGGALWVEHGWDQAGAVRQLLSAAGLRDVASRRDLAGIERISGGYL